jgi:TatD DNase family protein
MHFVDSHAHLTEDSIYGHIEDIIKEAQNADVRTIINICIDEPNLQRGIELKQRFPWIYLAAAVHPHDAGQKPIFFDSIVEKAYKGELVAIGETGLDYHYEHSKRAAQQNFLRLHLKLALETQLPVIIHCREAFDDFFSILDQEYQLNGKHAPGVLHCFTGTFEEAEKVLARGWYISLSGIITFKKGEELREIAKRVPLDRLLIETDTPYLAPQSKRGKPNQPSYLPEIAQTIATVKELPVEKIAEITQSNAYKLFNLS